jgi:hypothetical protein
MKIRKKKKKKERERESEIERVKRKYKEQTNSVRGRLTTKRKSYGSLVRLASFDVYFKQTPNK